MEIHVAGHRVDADATTGLLIDSHDAAVATPVWDLLERLTARIGPRPTLVERDGNLPPFADGVSRAFGLPVYDVITLGRWFYSGLIQTAYPQSQSTG